MESLKQEQTARHTPGGTPRYLVVTDGLTTTPIFSRRYVVVDTLGPKDDAGRFLKSVLQTDDIRRASNYAYELNVAKASVQS